MRLSVWRRLVGDRFRVETGLALLALLVVLLRTYPISFWEFDELLFDASVLRFDPLLHHPHPPGYPVFVGLAKAFNFVLHDPFTALVALSLVSSLAGFIALAFAFRNMLRDGRLAIFGALLFYLSPGMLVHATLPLSDATALALLAVTFYAASRGETALGDHDAVLLGLTASLAVGCRPQLAVLVVPLLVFVIIRDASWQRGSTILAVFAVVSVFWLLPLVVATGGIRGFLRYELGQAANFAANDADLARSGRSWADVVLRFVAHPWGPKLLSIPVLACAAAGVVAAARQREARLLPVVAASGAYLGFAALTMDPADGVRYALPAAMGATALLAARGLGWIVSRPSWRPAILVPVVAYGVGALIYVNPIVSPRHTSPSPPVQAAEYADSNLPADAVILFEAPLWPHARQLFSRFRSLGVHEGLDEYYDRPEVPIYVLADGGSASVPAKTFSWPDSDAYRKLTRNHYRVVSLIPIPPERRYRAIREVQRPERVPDGRSWRWLGPNAAVELPDLGDKTAVVRLALPEDYPLGSNDVKVFVNGTLKAEGVVRPDRPAEIAVDLLPGRNRLRIVSEQSFVPAEIPGGRNRDRRRVAVMLVSIEQRP